MSQTQALEIIEIPLEKIKPSPYQPRLEFDLEDLRGSIIRYGIRDPLKVRKVGDDWELIDGERRWRIAQQEGMKTVPCLVLDYTDEEADALAWRFNTERRDYSLEERAKHFKNHQKEGLSGAAIGRIHGYDTKTINRLLGIFRLPEKYQVYLWTGEFAYAKYEYLYDKGLLNSESRADAPEVINIIDESVDRRLNQREFENVVDGYLSDLEKRQIEEARKAVAQLEASKRREERTREAIGEPEVKPPETPEEFEQAAKVLRRRAKELKTPEQIMEEKRGKAEKALLNGKGSTLSKIERAKELGIETKELEERLEQIMAKIHEDPDEAIKEARELKRDVNDSIEFYEEEEERRRLEEELREKIEKEVEEKTVQTMLSTPEYIEVAKSLPTLVVTETEKPVIIPKEEVEAIKSRYEDVKQRVDEIIKQPEVRERGRLFRNWNAHYTIVQGIQNAFCPDHPEGTGILVWSCCSLPAKEALQKTGDSFEESQKEE